MKIKLLILMASVLAILFVAGTARASDGTIDTTGPNSDNHVQVSTNVSTNVTNTNTIKVVNNNDQKTTSGDANASGNTTTGEAASGDTSAANNTNTVVAINNNGVTSGGSGSGQVSTAVGKVGDQLVSSGLSGDSLGLLVGAVDGMGSGNAPVFLSGGSGVGMIGQATLPETGPSSPIDVSGLRSMFQPGDASNGITAVSKTNRLSGLLVVLGGLLSLGGVALSFGYLKIKKIL